MGQTYRAPNGETIVANDDVQAAAFESAGLEPVDGTKPRRQSKQSD